MMIRINQKNGNYFLLWGVYVGFFSLILNCHQTVVIPSKSPRLGESIKGVKSTSRSYILGYFEGSHSKAECSEGIENFRIFRSISDFVIHIFLGGIYDTRSVEVECFRPKLDFTSIQKSGSMILKGVHFNSNSDQILNESHIILDEFSKYLKENSNLRILILGHTDLNGNQKRNDALSLERASATKMFLISKGIDSPRMEIKGLGSKKPMIRSLDERASSLNRRIEIQVLKGKDDDLSKKRIEAEDDSTENYTTRIIFRNGSILNGNIVNQTANTIRMERKGEVQDIPKDKIRKIEYIRKK
ncbi:OmpA family protein [Leptospira sp. 201903070]|uniref:OmpA family protein n=1 Tax=Leptospira ainlahdjerensis TaxID=2810033 RepID=A0ABS2U8S1_9LEPT|nr:OmpA family protein [Leptospira ainlahdjerensis]MBM9575948.1 OmpA family protein [Leptospira ainlahdjerensis]